ncbi:MAG TPA: serine/threonine-protein kinase [Kofleriaceae bacterium]|nr:serine/threonine-protein kinase [Kofleriaceae bacterium]
MADDRTHPRPPRPPRPPGPPGARTQRGVAKLGVTKLGVAERRRAQDLLGEVVMGRYVIEAELGAGAMGTVYRGRHVRLPRNVAIKVLHEDYATHPTMLARFRREAEAAGRLRHPNVSGVLDVGETADGHPLMVMDLVEGASLRAILDGGPGETLADAGDTLDAADTLVTGLGRPRIINFVRQLLAGLDHAHAAGLVHRDLKPDNVIVEIAPHGGEVPRIVDFGIAALRTDEAPGTSRLTETGVLLGTPLYMAPEQARGDEVDHRADLFALGIMMFEMLAGTMPFDGSSIEVVVANMNEDLPAIADRAPHVACDRVLELFMRRLAARDPAHRFASARDALAMLDHIERDPEDAAVRLGQTDIARAIAVVWLPH